MKTIKQIQKLMSGLASEMAECPPRKRKNQIRKELAYLKDILLLLETKPKKAYLAAESIRIKNVIAQINERYPRKQGLLSQKRAYEKERGIPALKQHLKNIQFIIS